jgi:diguanylate cyclase (GGDEF)-like protein
MKAPDIESELMQKPQAIDPITFAIVSVGFHLTGAGLLVYLTWGLIDDVYLYNWIAVVTTVLLCSLLGLSIVKRKSSSYIPNVSKWETTHTYFGGVASATMSIGYCYGVVLSDPALVASLAFFLALHSSCITASLVRSKKIFLTSLLSLSVPFIATLLTLGNSNTIMLGASLSLFVIVLILLNLSINRAILSGTKVNENYESEVKLLQKYKNKFYDTTFEDVLTGLFNRRFFNFMINEEIRRAKRTQTALSIVIIEIDCFPEYAKNYGVAQGDKCIASIAQILNKTSSRGGEFITRFDDAKFALIAPNVKTNEAIAFISKMINLVSKANLEHNFTLATSSLQVSISAGIAEFKASDIIDVTEIIERAECALKTARENGYSNVQIFPQNSDNNQEKGIEAKKVSGTLHDLKIAQLR